MADNTDYYDLYFYPNEVLINNYGIRDDDELYEIESLFVETKSLTVHNIKGNFDFEHLKAINKHLLGGIYWWAGQIRKIDTFKLESNNQNSFLHWEDIEGRAEKVFSKLKKSNYLEEYKQDKNIFAEKICELYIEINEMHSFVEGNGRTQNEFIRQLASKNNYVLDLQNKMITMDREEYYQLFQQYDITHNSSEILEKLFLANIYLDDN